MAIDETLLLTAETARPSVSFGYFTAWSEVKRERRRQTWMKHSRHRDEQSHLWTRFNLSSAKSEARN
jgi:hypothetical protein